MTPAARPAHPASTLPAHTLPSAPGGKPLRREIVISLVIVVSALGVALADDDAGARTWLQVRRDLARTQARVAALAQRVEALEAEARDLAGSPLGLERAIREELGLARAGETVVRGLDGPAPELPPGPAREENASETPRNP